MAEPTFSADGYPTDVTLDLIRNWPIATLADHEAVMDFAGRAWSEYGIWTKERDWIDPEWPTHAPYIRYVLVTGGWSGNESIVSAIETNLMVQMTGAWAWRRGGWYEYRFPREADHA